MSKPEPINRDIEAAFESLQRAAAARAAKEAEANRPQADPLEAEKQLSTKVIQLDFWDDGKRGAPNAIFRSALFPALNNKQPRRFLKEERLFSVAGIEAFFTGERFDQ